MADLPTQSIQRIADARRDAETELKKALAGVKESDDVAPCLSAFTSFASSLFDAEAGELLTVCEDAAAYQTAIAEGVAPRIIEGILPEHSLKRVTARWTDEVKRLSIEGDMDADLLWEVGPDGTRKPARDEVLGVFAQHGDWENFMPKGVRHWIRMPNDNAAVHTALSQTLKQRVSYWEGQFQLRSTAGGRSARNRLLPSAKQTESPESNYSDDSGESTTETRKRGRPQKISDDRKAQAQVLKDSGRTNREAAIILYETNYPTPQQVKNVSSILRGHRNKNRKQASLPIQVTPKPRKLGG